MASKDGQPSLAKKSDVMTQAAGCLAVIHSNVGLNKDRRSTRL